MQNFGIPYSILDSQMVEIKFQINHMHYTTITTTTTFATKVHKYIE